MKTLRNITATLSLMALLISLNLNAETFNLIEEDYINDIPFNTEEVVKELEIENDLIQFQLEEEGYIDDIPFDTECVTAQCRYNKAMEVTFDMEEEKYVNDIPFDTYQAVLQVSYRAAMEKVFNFDDENYVDDIPVELVTSIHRNNSMKLVLHKNK